jgi:parallel beta-helix repeat protein
MKRFFAIASIFLMIITLTLFSAPSLMINTHGVEAQGFIYIMADGSVQPSDSPIIILNNVTYTLSGDIAAPIIVQRSHIVFEGGNYSLQGTGGGSGSGITLQNVENVTISSMNIAAFTTGIALLQASNCSVLSSTITSNNVNGIDVLNSNGTTVTGNNMATNGWHGLSLTDSLNSNVTDNHVSANGLEGIWIQTSPYTTLKNNVMENNLNLGITGSDVLDFINDIDTSNTVNGNMVYYFTNQQNMQINPSAYPNIGYLGIVNSTNVTVSNVQLVHNGQGMLLAHTNYSVVETSSFMNNQWGITLYSSWNNNISRNNIIQNALFGVEIDSLSNANTLCSNNISMSLRGVNLEAGSSGNRICLNNITQNFEKGVDFFTVSGNTVSDNIIMHNGNGIVLADSSYNNITRNYIAANQFFGIVMQLFDSGCFNNTITLNMLDGNTHQGIHVEDSYNTLIFMNNITNNLVNGIFLRRSVGNVIYENNFVNNTVNADSTGCFNIWDNGTTGNFWSDYNGTGTEPYVIDANNRDNHPITQILQIPESSFLIVLSALIIIMLVFVTASKRKASKAVLAWFTRWALSASP